MDYYKSNKYVLKYQLKESHQYKFTEEGICINTKTGNIIKKVINGRSLGYCINGKFKSVNTLRKQIIKIQKVKCPF